MTTYWRISSRPMTEADCHEDHVSRMWTGDGNERAGVSVCRTYDDLLSYFAGDLSTSVGRGACYRGAYLVELEGVESDDEAWESDCGERLIHPTRIVFCEAIAELNWVEHLLERIGESRRLRNHGLRAVYDERSCIIETAEMDA